MQPRVNSLLDEFKFAPVSCKHRLRWKSEFHSSCYSCSLFFASLSSWTSSWFSLACRCYPLHSAWLLQIFITKCRRPRSSKNSRKPRCPILPQSARQQGLVTRKMVMETVRKGGEDLRKTAQWPRRIQMAGNLTGAQSAALKIWILEWQIDSIIKFHDIFSVKLPQSLLEYVLIVLSNFLLMLQYC